MGMGGVGLKVRNFLRPAALAPTAPQNPNANSQTPKKLPRPKIQNQLARAFGGSLGFEVRVFLAFGVSPQNLRPSTVKAAKAVAQRMTTTSVGPETGRRASIWRERALIMVDIGAVSWRVECVLEKRSWRCRRRKFQTPNHRRQRRSSDGESEN